MKEDSEDEGNNNKTAPFKWNEPRSYPPQQSDSSSCGPYMCEFARLICYKKNLGGSPFDNMRKDDLVSFLRGRILLSILSDQLWVPQSETPKFKSKNGKKRKRGE